jgi:hypothetical protein
MSSEKLKEHLLQIASNVKRDTQLGDIYEQLALLADIDESEEQEKLAKVISHEEAFSRTRQWVY